MSYPLVKFVDGPSVGATVRLDLNDSAATAPRGVEADFDLGVPTLEGDPDAVGQQWGFRSPRFVVQIKGTKANALAFVSALSKEMLRRTNWLMFQPSAALSPVWLKTYRTGYQSLELERVFGNRSTGGNAPAGYPDVWRVEVPLVADAFAYGARVTIATATIVQNSTGTNPMKLVLPAIKGDAPTALRVKFTTSVSNPSAGAGAGWLVGCICGDASATDPVINIGTGDGFTATGGTGAASTVGGSAYFSGDYRAITIAAATPNLLARLNGSFTGLPIGRYKVLLRYEIDGSFPSTTTALFQLQVQTANGPRALAAATRVPGNSTAPTNGEQGWVDLGEMSLPVGQRPTSDAGVTTADIPWILLIGTATGVAITGKIDAFKLIPIDTPTLANSRLLNVAYANQVNAAQPAITVDGDSENWWATFSGALTPFPPVAGLSGSFPVADPAQAQNTLEFIALMRGDTASANNATAITIKDAATAVDVSYCPRYLHVGDGT